MGANRDNWSLFRAIFSDRLGLDRGGGRECGGKLCGLIVRQRINKLRKLWS